MAAGAAPEIGLRQPQVEYCPFVTTGGHRIAEAATPDGTLVARAVVPNEDVAGQIRASLEHLARIAMENGL